jgi:hypothetical protein
MIGEEEKKLGRPDITAGTWGTVATAICISQNYN